MLPSVRAIDIGADVQLLESQLDLRARRLDQRVEIQQPPVEGQDGGIQRQQQLGSLHILLVEMGFETGMPDGAAHDAQWPAERAPGHAATPARSASHCRRARSSPKVARIRACEASDALGQRAVVLQEPERLRAHLGVVGASAGKRLSCELIEQRTPPVDDRGSDDHRLEHREMHVPRLGGRVDEDGGGCEELDQLLVADIRQDGRIGDLAALPAEDEVRQIPEQPFDRPVMLS